MTVENRLPIAENHTFYINREDHFQSDISVKLGSSAITVKGSVLGNGDFNATSGLPEGNRTLEYGFSRHPISGGTTMNEALISEPGSNFFSRFFKDETGNGLTEDALEAGDEILTLKLDPGMTPEQMYAQVTAASAQAQAEGKILYITSSSPDTPLALNLSQGMTFGDLSQQISDTWTRYQANIDTRQYYREAIAYNNQTRDAYLEQFILGQRSLLDVLDAENELFNSSTQYVTVDGNVIIGAYHLYALAGDLLSKLGLDGKMLYEPAAKSKAE